jgi:site-specific recombinase XerC
VRPRDLREPHPFEELWEGWARAMRVRGLTKGTIDSRRTNWRKWMDHVGDGWACADHRAVEEWLDGRPLAENATCRAVSDLASFYRWARRNELAMIDPTDLVERPRIPKRLPRPADVPGIERALALGLEDNRRAVALMYYAGLRCCEVSRLQWGPDVDLLEGWLTVLGKGNKTRKIPIFPPLEPFLAAGVGEKGHVYRTKRGRPARPERVSSLVNEHLRAAGCPFSAHQIRHRFATHMLDRTKNLRLVQVLLGHANVATTEIYTLIELDGYGGLHDLW